MFAKALTRGMPVALASTFLHIGVAAGLVVAAGGHHAAAASSTMQLIDVDITDFTAAEEPKVPPTEEAPSPLVPATPAPAHQQPTHSHAYPVAPSHDAHPHDPAIVHETAGAPPAQMQTVAAPESPPASLPKFTITLGGNTASSGGGGNNAAAATSGAPHTHDANARPFAESDVSRRATLLSSAPASYPNDARMSELEADVPLEIVVDTNGAVIDARVLQQRSGSGFDESALAAIRRYRFKPAERDGHPVIVRMRWVVQFRLH